MLPFLLGQSRNPFLLFGQKFQWFEEDEPLSSADVVLLVRQNKAYAAGIRWSHGGNGLPSFATFPGAYAYRFHSLADFLIDSQGANLRLFPRKNAQPALLAFVLGRAMLPRLLHLRGITCLHASAVQMGRRAAAFIGPSGSGKSTLAALLVKQGNRLLTDDVLPIYLRKGQNVWAGPGLGELRLEKDSARLYGLYDVFRPPPPPMKKWVWTPPEDAVQTKALPLHSLCLLNPVMPLNQQRAEIRSVGGHELFLMLQRNVLWVHNHAVHALASDLNCLGVLMRRVPAFVLSFPLENAGLDAAAHLIRENGLL
ncbi:MAG: hypothetical protein HY645_03915 [Acidobacteria bacterium]|nr:hypothetical protein [Acidobacteriota bacterium]